MELYELTAHELMEKLEKKEITMTDVIKSCFERINEKEKDVQAFVSIYEKEALSKAESRNECILPPIGIKDNINIKGTKTTCSSKMLENYVSPYNATIINKINDENITVLRKT